MNTLLLKKVDGIIGSGLTRLLPRPMKKAPELLGLSRLLLIRPGGIGDAVLLAPAIRAVHRAFPDAIIHILAESRNAAVFGLCPEVDEVFCYDRPKELLAVLGGKFDAVIDTEQWHRLSAVMARVIRSPVKIGFGTNERQKLFNYPVPYAHESYEIDSFFQLLHPLGITPPSPLEVPFLKVDHIAREVAEGLLGEFLHKPFIVLFPGASIPERRWGTEKFRAVVADMARRGVGSVVVGGREDADEGAKIIAGAGGLNLAGRTSLAETAAVICQGRALVSGDSGILHIGVGLGKPTVSLFGPGIAAKWAPQGERHIVLNHTLSCSPCTRFGYTPKCPENAECLSEIKVNEVTAATETLLLRFNVS
jgi:lipopolysaccharide heptosyltransferase II